MRDHSPKSLKRAAPLGFTLVEMLVVITIIGILMALLIPAVQMARRAAKQAQCLNNIRQVGQGALGYENSKGWFPGRNYAFSGPNNSVVNTPWTVALLPHLGRNDVYEAWPAVAATPPYIDFFVCPSDLDATATYSANAPPISYAVNAGRPDAYERGKTRNMDFKENGIFHNNYLERIGKLPLTHVSLSFIGKHDGTTNTILLSEKLAADVAPVVDYASWIQPGGTGADGTELIDAIVWLRTQTVPELPIKQWLLLLDGGGVKIAEPLANAQVKVKMRPSSNHPSGFNTVFADGSARFISDEISYRVYILLMTPYGKKAKEPSEGTLTASGPNAPAPWVAGILNEADL